MANGYWGSRLPVANFICTRFVFAGMWWGTARRRMINGLKRILNSQSIQTVNDNTTIKTMKKWLDAGYDKINMGGGGKNLDHFVNVDFVSHAGVEREIVANILDLSFVPTGCISHIHSNHVIEHLTDKQLGDQLKEYHRILKDEGLFTLRCPNALGASYGFWFEPVLEQKRDEFVKLGFPEDEDFGDPADKWMHKDLFGLGHWFYGDTGNIENQHLNIITPSKIKYMIEHAGFTVIKMAGPEAINIVIIAHKTAKL